MKEFLVEEDVKCQKLVNELYELLEKYDLNSIIMWEKDSKKLKGIDSVSNNENALQINSDCWLYE